MARRRTFLRLGALLALGLAACGPDAALDGLPDGGAAMGEAAPEGDVLILADGRRVELAGVIAPHGDEPYAERSRAALAAAAAGREMALLPVDAEGRRVHLRDRRSRAWLQGALLEAGAVRVRTTPQDRAMAKAMLRAEARARTAGRGLWAEPAYEVRLPSEVVAGRLSGFQIVEGRVVRAARTAARLYLEFGSDWRGGFSTETPLNLLGDFADADLDLEALEGRLVRVRGEVRATGYGPRLRLDHPEQVEGLAEPQR